MKKNINHFLSRVKKVAISVWKFTIMRGLLDGNGRAFCSHTLGVQ